MTGRTPAVVVCVAGPPGSGKSTFGAALAARARALLLDLDTATNPLLREVARCTGAGEDLDHPSLRGRVREARYACLVALARENVALGHRVVLVAPFTTEATDPTAWAGLTDRIGAPGRGDVRLVVVRVPPGVALLRRRLRGRSRDLTARQVPDARHGRAVPGPLVVDGTAATDDEVGRVLALLAWQGQVLPTSPHDG